MLSLLSTIGIQLPTITGDLLLDPLIRNWVLLPIFAVMFLQGLLRQYVSVLLKSDTVVAVDMLEKTQLIRRSQRLRLNSQYITITAFNRRKKYFLTEAFADTVAIGADGSPATAAAAAPQQDPFAMLNMMKQNLAMIVPQMLSMGWVSYFFTGFIIVKLPFNLTDRFKSMLQRGILLNSLDVSYVSSLSWYLVLVAGLRGLFYILLGSDSSAVDNPELLMAQQMQMQQSATGGGGGAGGQSDSQKLFSGEKKELEITQHIFVIPTAEHRILKLSTAP